METQLRSLFGPRSSNFLLLLLSLFCTQFLLSSFVPPRSPPTSSAGCSIAPLQQLKVYIADLPREFNYGLLESHCASPNSSCPPSRSPAGPHYPNNPLFNQHSAEFWLLADPTDKGSNPSFVRVADSSLADVVFVPFFAALSAQIQLRGSRRGEFRKRSADNLDFDRQQRVVELVTSSPEWRRSDGIDHVFVLSDPMAMWHVRDRIAAAMFLVVDFGGWYQTDDAVRNRNDSTSAMIIQHTQVSPIKDVIIPHTHLLPTLQLEDDQPRPLLLYFRGARHRHRSGLVRNKLWKILENEPGVVIQEGLPDENGLAEATRGMRSSQFCLSPAGDTPSSCRLYDAIASLCIPVIVSDDIHLPFEGTAIDYDEFCVFVSSGDATRPGWLVRRLREIGSEKRRSMRLAMSRVQRHFEYEVGNGAARLIWSGIRSKLPMIQESVARLRRKKRMGSVKLTKRCHCVS